MALPVLGSEVSRRNYGLLHTFGRWLFIKLGWRFEGNFPNVPRMVVAVAPHTTNWDFFLGLTILFALNLQGNWLGKHTIFRWPVNGLLRTLGGIPVNRTSSHGLVSETATAIKASKKMILGIAPEGTRSKGAKWKTGFYHIAREANVPIVPAYFDFANKVVGLGPALTPGGNMELDIKTLQDFCGRVAA